jgi:hypothetical protein
VLFGFMPNEIIAPRLADGEVQANRQRELINLASEIRVLKEDVRELLELIRLLAGFVPMPASGTEEEQVAIGFETRLAVMLNRHSAGYPTAGHQDAIEGVLLVSK